LGITNGSKTFLVLSQVYPPDPASVGQHMANAAAEMAHRGYRVVTICSGRGYDDPSKKYKPRETLDGVDVRRVPLASFGKRTILIRLLGQSLFLLQAFGRAVFLRNLTGILVSTSPPMCSIIALAISYIRGVPITYWAMDINPDQAVVMGKARAGSVPVRMFDWLNRRILGRAAAVVTLDRFMADRLLRKRDVTATLHVMPPWPHDDQLGDIAHETNPFRKEHGLDGRFVVMYSGNHSPANPLGTLLEAAGRVRNDPRFVFMFIGGGQAKKDVEKAIAEGGTNIRSLPYQPLESLKYSLSAADLHVVSVGDDVVGIVHPCKIYGAMSVGRPVLTFGPTPCHISELVEKHDVGVHVAHGQTEAAAAALRRFADMPVPDRSEMGRRAQRAVVDELSKSVLCGAFCDVAERTMEQADRSRVHAGVAAQGERP
jgi:glycosyltransferase involved in cell wall biosynthesis